MEVASLGAKALLALGSRAELKEALKAADVPEDDGINDEELFGSDHDVDDSFVGNKPAGQQGRQ